MLLMSATAVAAQLATNVAQFRSYQSALPMARPLNPSDVTSSCSAEQQGMEGAFAQVQLVMDSLVNSAAAREAEYMEQVVDTTPKPEKLENVGIIHVEFDVTWNMKSFDIPGIKVGSSTQDFIYNVPQVTMRQKNISFDTPATRWVDKKIGQKPETTCRWKIGWVLGVKTKKWECTTTWTDIITKVPETYMERKTISTDIPEVAMRPMRTSMSLPSVTVTSQRVLLRMPEFRIRWPDDVREEQEETAKQQASKFQAVVESASHQSQARLSEAVSYAQAVVAEKAVPMINAFYGCTRANVSAQQVAFAKAFAATIAQQEAVLELLEAQGGSNTPEAAAIRKAIADVRQEEQRELLKLNKLLEEINKQERDAVAGLMQKTTTEPLAQPAA
jgi:hypothetical protein